MTNIFTNPEMNDLRMSEKARPLFDAVVRHINDNVVPIAEEFEALGKGRADRWSWAPGQLELLQTAKDKAKAAGYQIKVGRFPFIGNGKAIALGETEGMIKTIKGIGYKFVEQSA